MPGCCPLREVVAELDQGRHVVSGDSGDLRQLVHGVGVDAAVALVPVQVAELMWFRSWG